MELRLMEAKHEANRTKEETERQVELEREVGNTVHSSQNYTTRKAVQTSQEFVKHFLFTQF